jgi:hypothetical protein
MAETTAGLNIETRPEEYEELLEAKVIVNIIDTAFLFRNTI